MAKRASQLWKVRMELELEELEIARKCSKSSKKLEELENARRARKSSKKLKELKKAQRARKSIYSTSEKCQLLGHKVATILVSLF